MIPKPFSKCFISMGPPIWEAMENNNFKTEDLDNILMKATDNCDKKIEKTF